MLKLVTCLLLLTALCCAQISVHSVDQFATGGAGSKASPWTGWETALNALPIDQDIYFPCGEYTQSVKIDLKRGWHLHGGSSECVKIKSSFAGDAFGDTQPINHSNGVWITVEDIALINRNPANTGAGYDDVAGTEVVIRHCRFVGFKYGIILDQTELADLEMNDIESPGTAGIWLVNGGDHTPGANLAWTNRIEVKSNQINSLTAPYAVIDDGGTNHTFLDNNINGFQTYFRIAGDSALSIIGNEMESGSKSLIEFSDKTMAGYRVGPSITVAIGPGNLLMGSPTATVNLTSDVVTTASLRDNRFITGEGDPPLTVSPGSAIVSEGNLQTGGGPPIGNITGATWSGTIFGSFATAGDFSSFTPDRPIILTRIDVTAGSAPQGCTALPYVAFEGIPGVSVSLENGKTQNTGAFNLLLPAGKTVVAHAYPGVGCATQAANASVVFHD